MFCVFDRNKLKEISTIPIRFIGIVSIDLFITIHHTTISQSDIKPVWKLIIKVINVEKGDPRSFGAGAREAAACYTAGLKKIIIVITDNYFYDVYQSSTEFSIHH